MPPLARRIPWLAILAIASAVALAALLAAALASRHRIRIAHIGYGDAFLAVGAHRGDLALQLRRRHTPGRFAPLRRGFDAFTTSYSAGPLTALCIRQHGDRWLLPGLWLGAGRDTYVHYADVLLPVWLTLPACLLLPAAWYSGRPRHARGFAVVPTASCV